MGSDAHPRQVETVVVGAGQAGLVMSSFLSDAGREHELLGRRDTLGGGGQLNQTSATFVDVASDARYLAERW